MTSSVTVVPAPETVEYLIPFNVDAPWKTMPNTPSLGAIDAAFACIAYCATPNLGHFPMYAELTPTGLMVEVSNRRGVTVCRATWDLDKKWEIVPLGKFTDTAFWLGVLSAYAALDSTVFSVRMAQSPLQTLIVSILQGTAEVKCISREERKAE